MMAMESILTTSPTSLNVFTESTELDLARAVAQDWA
jgi:hypothetical protein